MTIIQTLHDALFAIAVTVGIAVAVTIAFTAAGALSKRDKVRATEAVPPVTSSAQYPTYTPDTRELVGR